jgi:glycosyltransferase involved in cell wall biosynthesis
MERLTEPRVGSVVVGPVTVVVPTRDRPDQLRDCLAAVRAAVSEADEVVVVDSASRAPAAVARVATSFGATLLRLEEPGASRARNAGWRAARHDVVVFTDDDCVPQAGWTRAFAERFATAPDLTVLWGPATVAVEGTGTTDVPADGPTHAVHGDDIGPLGASCNLAVRRTALLTVGGFDELLGAGVPLRAAEDKDLLLRLLAAGGVAALESRAVVQHEVWRSRSAAVRLNHHYGIGQGALFAKARRLGVDPHQSFPDGLLRTPLRQAGQALLAGYETGVLTSAARAAGVMRGRWKARRLSVVDGHLSA